MTGPPPPETFPFSIETIEKKLIPPPKKKIIPKIIPHPFAFVLVRTCLSLYSIRALAVFDTLMYYLKAKFAIDISPGDLTFDLPRNAPVSVSYTLLDVLFVVSFLVTSILSLASLLMVDSF